MCLMIRALRRKADENAARSVSPRRACSTSGGAHLELGAQMGKDERRSDAVACRRCVGAVAWRNYRIRREAAHPTWVAQVHRLEPPVGQERTNAFGVRGEA